MSNAGITSSGGKQEEIYHRVTEIGGEKTKKRLVRSTRIKLSNDARTPTDPFSESLHSLTLNSVSSMTLW